MPEMPEVETVRAGLEPFMAGQRIDFVDLKRPNLRFPFPQGFAQTCEGQTILQLRRKAKFLLIDLSNGLSIVSHLGMSGTFFVRTFDEIKGTSQYYHTKGHNSTHQHVVMGLQNGTHIIYEDPRRFGFMDLVTSAALSEHPSLSKLGPDPFEEGYTLAHLQSALQDKKAPMKALLLDQSLVSGLGNIYVCEALFEAGICPTTTGEALSQNAHKVEALYTYIKEVLVRAVKAGGSSLKDFSGVKGQLGLFQHAFHVYDRKGQACKRNGCDGVIERIVQSGRSTFYCPKCQK